MSEQEWVCDDCQKPFRIESLTKIQNEEGSELYFICPHCKKRYTVAKVSPLGVQLYQRIDRLKKQGKTNTGRFRRLVNRYSKEVVKPD